MCNVCEDHYVFLYSGTELGLTKYDECVETKDPNCLIGELNAKCYKCKPGFYLNVDNHCDEVTNKKCIDHGNYV